MDNRPIGIIDSGVGGLSIWKEIVTRLPYESTTYIADSKYCPYGTRESEEIYLLAKRLVSYLIEHNAKLIVLACNTITVNALSKLRVDFPHVPIIGTVPVIKTAVEQTHNKKIGILSTERTATSEYQVNLLRQFAQDCEVINIGTNKLVPYIEKGEIAGKEIEDVVKTVLEPFKRPEVDVIALGCTHFPFLKPVMQKILGPDVLLLDSGQAIARQVARVLGIERELATDQGIHTLVTTGDKDVFEKTIDILLPSEKDMISKILSLAI